MRRLARSWPVAFSRSLSLSRGRADGRAAGRQSSTCGSRIPQPVETGKKIEVIEFFSYGCPHCGEFEPDPAGLAQDRCRPTCSSAAFRWMFQERWVPLAKIYYTLEALGEEARLSPESLRRGAREGLSLWQDKTFFDWAASQGLDRKKVEDSVQLVRDRQGRSTVRE